MRQGLYQGEKVWQGLYQGEKVWQGLYQGEKVCHTSVSGLFLDVYLLKFVKMLLPTIQRSLE